MPSKLDTAITPHAIEPAGGGGRFVNFRAVLASPLIHTLTSPVSSGHGLSYMSFISNIYGKNSHHPRSLVHGGPTGEHYNRHSPSRLSPQSRSESLLMVLVPPPCPSAMTCVRVTLPAGSR